MKARVSHLHKTEAEWEKLNSWKPEAGELIIYDPDATTSYARIKVGDGQHCLKELTFFIKEAAKDILEKQQHSAIIDAGRITDYL